MCDRYHYSQIMHDYTGITAWSFKRKLWHNHFNKFFWLKLIDVVTFSITAWFPKILTLSVTWTCECIYLYIYIKGRSNLEAYCSDLNKLYLGYSRHYNRLKKKVQFQAILSHFPGSSVRLLHFIYGIEVPSEFHGDFDWLILSSTAVISEKFEVNSMVCDVFSNYLEPVEGFFILLPLTYNLLPRD